MHSRSNRSWLAPWLLGAVASLVLTACAGGDKKPAPAAAPATSTTLMTSSAPTPTPPTTAAAPSAGTCWSLTPADAAKPSNDTSPVDCTQTHTAVTFGGADFPNGLRNAAYDDPRLGGHVWKQCSPTFVKYLGGGQSMAMRSLLSWSWFRPSQDDWNNGARWFTCGVVSGSGTATRYRPLPPRARNMLGARPPESWMLCAQGPSLATAARVPCAGAHVWRAVTTIVLSEKKTPYPGDHMVEVTSRAFCSDSVGAWLNYPVTNYDYGVTTFHEAEWQVGNRRSICWARTAR